MECPYCFGWNTSPVPCDGVMWECFDCGAVFNIYDDLGNGEEEVESDACLCNR